MLIRSAEALERLERVDTLVLDKTGTLTEGRPRVIAVMPAGEWSESDMLVASASVERASEHPLAAAIVSAAQGARAVRRRARRLSFVHRQGRHRRGERPCRRAGQCGPDARPRHIARRSRGQGRSAAARRRDGALSWRSRPDRRRHRHRGSDQADSTGCVAPPASAGTADRHADRRQPRPQPRRSRAVWTSAKSLPRCCRPTSTR